MSTSRKTHVPCPKCGNEIALTASAQLQTRRLGVSCRCPDCADEWVHNTNAPVAHNARRNIDEPAPDHGRPNQNSTPERRKSVVYVVDDDSAVRNSLECLLSAAGWNVELYGSADEFLCNCEIERPGCLLLDLHMPGIGGLELQQQLRRIRCTIPVIIMTGRGDIATAVRALKNGAFDFFEKPADPSLLVSRIRQAVEHDHQTHRDQTSTANEPALEQMIAANGRCRTPAFLGSQTTRQPADLPVS